MPETKKKIPMCGKCNNKIITKLSDGSFALIGCEEDDNIMSYEDAVSMCPLINQKQKILIIINGGVAYLEIKPKGIEVEIRDYDVEGIDAEGDERCKKDLEDDWYQEMIWESDVEVP